MMYGCAVGLVTTTSSAVNEAGSITPLKLMTLALTELMPFGKTKMTFCPGRFIPGPGGRGMT